MTKRPIFILSFMGLLGHLIGQPLLTAEEALKKVRDNYNRASRILIEGNATFERPGLDGVSSSPFIFAFELTDKFHIDGVPAVFGLEGDFSDRSVWIGNGETTLIYGRRANTYYKIPRSSPRGSVGLFAIGYPAAGRPEQFVAYLRMAVPGWSPDVLDQHRVATITGSQSLSVNSKQIECLIVQSEDQGFATKSDGATRESLFVDKHRFVVWRLDELMWVNAGNQYHVRIDMKTVKLDEPLPKRMFKFRPPKGSRLVAFQ